MSFIDVFFIYRFVWDGLSDVYPFLLENS